MTLHQIMSNDPSILKRISQTSGADDALLLCGDGCYQAVRLNTRNKVFALKSDFEGRGLDHTDITLIDDFEWIELTVSHTPVISWT